MFENLTTHFENLASEKKYWFLRTMSGNNFEAFTSKGFIGINWNYVTFEHLRNSTDVEIRNLIAANERDRNGELYNPTTGRGKAKITSIFTKLQRFKNLKSGDIVVIPSGGSRYLAFGTIIDDEIYNDFNDNSCDFHKRRRVNWIVTERLDDLDDIWYKIIFSMHAISDLSAYASHIDKIVSSVFVKDDRSHLVLQVLKQGDINYDSLNGVLKNVRALTENININFNLGEDLSGNSVKLNVQSPGAIEFIYNTGRSLLLASVFLSVGGMVTSCGHGERAATATQAEKDAERANNIALIGNTIDNDDRFDENEKERLKDFAAINYDTIAMTKQNMAEIESLVKN
jgi:restriction system protein